MSEFTPLREAVDTLASRSPSPDFGDLKRRATRRGRRRVVVAAGAAACIAVGGGLSVGTLGVSDQVLPVGEPAPTTVQESAEPTPKSIRDLSAELDAIVAQVPGWAITTDNFPPDYDYAFNGPCSGNWRVGATSAGDGGIGPAGIGSVGFSSETGASNAAARMVENLKSCTATAWQIAPIASTGTVLASSADGVTWIQQEGTHVRVLQMATSDGPPPDDVQVEVAELMVAYGLWQESMRAG